MSLNICSLKSNFLNLQLEITDHFRPSVIGICETKITNEIETLYNIAGYNMFTNNNQYNKGGVALYIKNSIAVMVKPEQTIIRNGIDTIFADLSTPSGIIIITVGSVYKLSVDISTENFSIALEEIIFSLGPNIKMYIMVDFNINHLDYSTSPPVENFLNLIISRNYYPVITRPTRVTPISCTLIDNIFYKTIDQIESTGVITINISDHYPIFSRELRPSLADNVLSINYRVFSD